MKINQLFNKPVNEILVLRILVCFGLHGFRDRRQFCKHDLQAMNTVATLGALIPELSTYYMPCKAKTYLQNINEKKCITILKQVIRLYGMTLISKERNVRGKKIIYYHVMGSGDFEQSKHMTSRPQNVTVSFT